jgi:hypothetical protein
MLYLILLFGAFFRQRWTAVPTETIFHCCPCLLLFRTTKDIIVIIIIIIIIIIKLLNQQVQTVRTNNKPDIIIRDNKKGTCMSTDAAIPGDRKCDQERS